MPAGKVVIGIPVYGRTWTLRDAGVNGIGAPANGTGPGEPGGVMLYSDVVEFNWRNATVVVYDDVVVAAYSYGGTAWVGYDDRRSVKAKARYGRRKGVGGYFLWALGFDDKRWSLSRRENLEAKKESDRKRGKGRKS
ncbi:hypothetical protein HPP92_017743 [Vanilla planifolia]|uniref:GH18 domain-containing protein n=1 Tax=Vanilla planifolia TaxID=51239 RepID=A0A835UPX8_VANPL|nr:hypothetical protein HPP92_017743 [Vanilla planifolia]